MLLLIPEAVKKLKEAGREEARQEMRARMQEVLDRHGDKLTPEVIEELRAKLLGPDSGK